MAGEDLVWLPAVCEHGKPNTSGIAKLQRGCDYRFDSCFSRKGSRKEYFWHVADKDAEPGNRLVPAKKPRRQRSDKGVKRGPRT